MSLLRWFSRKKKQEALPSMMPSSGLSRLDSTRPFHAAKQPGTGQPANRKHERLERRELLYAVVRESMVRAGVLSSAYKFKVLSLDPRGRQFLVMIDLAQGAGHDTSRLAEIEALIAQSAKARHHILVTAVYWRSNEHVAVGEQAVRASRPAPLESAPAPLMESPSRPAPLRAAPPRKSVDPIHPDEVVAFKRALSASTRGEQALAAAGAQPHSYTLLTGFEDTEMAEGDGSPELGGSQYGALR